MHFRCGAHSVGVPFYLSMTKRRERSKKEGTFLENVKVLLQLLREDILQVKSAVGELQKSQAVIQHHNDFINSAYASSGDNFCGCAPYWNSMVFGCDSGHDVHHDATWDEPALSGLPPVPSRLNRAELLSYKTSVLSASQSNDACGLRAVPVPCVADGHNSSTASTREISPLCEKMNNVDTVVEKFLDEYLLAVALSQPTCVDTPLHVCSAMSLSQSVESVLLDVAQRLVEEQFAGRPDTYVIGLGDLQALAGTLINVSTDILALPPMPSTVLDEVDDLLYMEAYSVSVHNIGHPSFSRSEVHGMLTVVAGKFHENIVVEEENCTREATS